MHQTTLARTILAATGVYDLGLGIAFIVAAPQVFDAIDAAPPNHWAYVHFAAGMLAIFGLMFLTAAARPYAYRILIPFGILLKIAYCATVLYYAMKGPVESVWTVFGYLDAVWAIALAWTWWAVRPRA